MATGSSSAPQPAISIRRATAGDLQQLLPLLQRYYTEWDVWEHDSPERVLEYVEQPLPFGYIVAECAGSLLGCVMLRRIPAIALAGECKRLFVVPEARGHGLASQLMDHLEALAAGHRLTWVYLDTDVQFRGAISLYQRRGYEPCERFNDNQQASLFFRKRVSA